MLHVNVDLYHTTNRTATTNGPISLAGAAGLGKYGYGNGIAVMERISGTVLIVILIFLTLGGCALFCPHPLLSSSKSWLIL